MKELPATLIMPRFDFFTRVVQKHWLDVGKRLVAAPPSLVVVGLRLLPVLQICRSIAARGRERPQRAGPRRAPAV